MNLSFLGRIRLITKIYDPLELLIKKVFRQGIRLIFAIIQSISNPNPGSVILLISNDLSTLESEEINNRIRYYIPDDIKVNQKRSDALSIEEIFSPVPIMVFGDRSRIISHLLKYRPGTYDIDYRVNAMDGWAWAQLSAKLDSKKLDIKGSQEKFIKKINLLKKESKNRCYIFGTGPSLEKAIEKHWEDGYVIVCNTIVRDPELWQHLDPDFIVAGDAIYHFGHTRFAQAFRSDLKARLRECETLFVYPAQFHALVRREFEELDSQLVPIPSTWKRQIDSDLTHFFNLPNLGNVLGLLLLPIACTLSDNVYLWGFDGRNPKDKLFWSNSKKHSYPEYLDDLLKAHPRFYEYYVPSSDPEKYVQAVQGDQLDNCLRLAEDHGKTFVMMHPSWTPTLQKRFRGEK